MTRCPRIALAAALTAVALAALTPSAQASGSMATIAQRGFGDRANSISWGMAWFRGHLYVGTGRNVACTEAATTDYYFPVAKTYKQMLQPSVHCPRTPYAMDQRAEIWRYSPRTGRWAMVYRSPTVVNPRSRGRRIARDIAYRGFSVHRNRRGRVALFVSGVSPDEYVPELARSNPPRLLRTYDGRHFHDMGGLYVVHKTGKFTDQRPIGYRGMQWWRGKLYVLASTALAGDGAVFRVDHPFGRRGRFRQISPSWMYVFELKQFAGALYLGAGSRETGYSVYKTYSGKSPYRFRAVVKDGAGRGPVMTGVIAMQEFRKRLYVSAVSWYCDCTMLPTTEMIRIAPDDSWQVVVGRPRQTADGRTRQPISGLMDGFENIFMTHIWRMTRYGRTLYAGTLDWTYLLQGSKDWLGANSGLLGSVLAGELGFDLWASCDGRDWFSVTRTAFGGDQYDFGGRSVLGTPAGLFVGTANHAYGTRIFHARRDVCDPLTGPGSRDPGVTHTLPSRTPPAARAAGLLTDVQRGGTVLSWDTAQPRTPVRVERAAYSNIPLSYTQPLPGRNGFWGETATPTPVRRGTPGSISVDVPVQLAYRSIGTTTRSYFVDRTRRPGSTYAYRVVPVVGAASGDGGSNVQVVPDPRPPATWSSLRRALGPRVATASGAPSLGMVEQLARTASGDDARELAYRLARRMRYADIAGGR